jgi:hypothetical protein
MMSARESSSRPRTMVLPPTRHAAIQNVKISAAYTRPQGSERGARRSSAGRSRWKRRPRRIPLARREPVGEVELRIIFASGVGHGEVCGCICEFAPCCRPAAAPTPVMHDSLPYSVSQRSAGSPVSSAPRRFPCARCSGPSTTGSMTRQQRELHQPPSRFTMRS